MLMRRHIEVVLVLEPILPLLYAYLEPIIIDLGRRTVFEISYHIRYSLWSARICRFSKSERRGSIDMTAWFWLCKCFEQSAGWSL